MLAYLDPALLKCADLECALKAARALSADTALLGTITKQGEKIVLSVKLIDVKLGKSIKASTTEAGSKGDLPRVIPILLSTLLGTPVASASGGSGLTADQVNQQKLEVLEALRAELKATIAEINKKRSVAHTWGWSLMGVGAVSAGLSGVCWYLADQAYQGYQSTGGTSEAEYYRGKVTLWDTLMLVSAGTSVLSFGGAIPSFALSPNSRAESNELKRVETEISALEVPEGISK